MVHMIHFLLYRERCWSDERHVLWQLQRGICVCRWEHQRHGCRVCSGPVQRWGRRVVHQLQCGFVRQQQWTVGGQL